MTSRYFGEDNVLDNVCLFNWRPVLAVYVKGIVIASNTASSAIYFVTPLSSNVIIGLVRLVRVLLFVINIYEFNELIRLLYHKKVSVRVFFVFRTLLTFL